MPQLAVAVAVWRYPPVPHPALAHGMADVTIAKTADHKQEYFQHRGETKKQTICVCSANSFIHVPYRGIVGSYINFNIPTTLYIRGQLTPAD